MREGVLGSGEGCAEEVEAIFIQHLLLTRKTRSKHVGICVVVEGGDPVVSCLGAASPGGMMPLKSVKRMWLCCSLLTSKKALN